MPIGYNAVGLDEVGLAQRFNFLEGVQVGLSHSYTGGMDAGNQPIRTEIAARQLGRQISEWSCVPACYEIVNHLWSGTQVRRQDDIFFAEFDRWNLNGTQPELTRQVFMPHNAERWTEVLAVLRCREIATGLAPVPFLVSGQINVQGNWAIRVSSERFPSNGGTARHSTVLGSWNPQQIQLAVPSYAGMQLQIFSWPDFLATLPVLSVLVPV